MQKILIVLALVLSFVLAARADEPLNLAVLPTTKIGHSPWWAPENYWLDRINRQLKLIAESDGQFDLVFIGDSITHNWEGWPEDPARLRNAAVNRIIEGFADGKKVVWVDFSKRFLQTDGTLSRSMMPDLLHPSAAGYAIWAEELLPYVRRVCQSGTETKRKRK